MMDFCGEGSAPDPFAPRDKNAAVINAFDEYPADTRIGRIRGGRCGNGAAPRRSTMLRALLYSASLLIVLTFVACGGSPRSGAQPQATSAARQPLTIAYVLMGSDLAAFDAATGRRLWHFVSARPASMPSLVLSGGVLYLSAGNLYALRASDGRLLWQTPVGAGALTSTLQFARGVLYIAADSVVSAVNTRDGTLLWHTQVGSGLDTLLVDSSSGTVYDGGGGLTALRADDGSQLWQVSTQGSGITSMQLAGGTLYAATTDNRLLALGPADGRLRWSYQDPAIQALSWPTIVGATVYLAAQATAATTSTTGSIGVQMLESVVALRANDGTTLWQRQLPIGLPPSAVENGLDPIVSNDGSTLYVVAGPSAGDVVALGATDGIIRWQVPSDDTLLALLGADSSTLYTGGISGVVSALSADGGTSRWRISLGQTSRVLQLSLERGTLYAATADGACAALDPSSGRIRWHTSVGSGDAASAGLTPPTIVVADVKA